MLAECSRRGLEGIVCKRKDAPYRSGTRSGWIEVNTLEWKAANQYRAKLFEQPHRPAATPTIAISNAGADRRMKFDDPEQVEKLDWMNNTRTPLPWPSVWLAAWRNETPICLPFSTRVGRAVTLVSSRFPREAYAEWALAKYWDFPLNMVVRKSRTPERRRINGRVSL